MSLNMSHIATTFNSQSATGCHYSGRAFRLARFYKCPMALRIRKLREEQGLTQEALAKMSHMSRSQLAMIEAETRPANTLRLNAIASALGVTPEELFQSDDDAMAILLRTARDLSPEDREIVARLAVSLAAKSPKA